MEKIYHGRGNEALYDDYFDFINYVFGFNGNSEDFKQLLPKIYRPEDTPVENSYITLDDGKLKAVVGAFDHKLQVCGIEINCRGIGNVAVHPYARSKGYMKQLMNIALDDMKKDGIDLSILGGRRQRYNYFSYDKGGSSYNFTINNDNLRHTYGKDRSAYHTLEVKKLTPDDKEIFAEIAKLINGQTYCPIREEARMYDILVSWHHVPYALLKDGEFAGYIVADSRKIYEIMTVDNNDFSNAIISFYDHLAVPSISVVLPEFCTDYIDKLYRLCEGYEIGLNKSFSVFNYAKVIDAFLKLKKSYANLPDGKVTMLIHGIAGDEKLCIGKSGDETFVKTFEGDADIELDHIDAMNMLFAPFCQARDRLPVFARVALPLPLWVYSTDAV